MSVRKPCFRNIGEPVYMLVQSNLRSFERKKLKTFIPILLKDRRYAIVYAKDKSFMVAIEKHGKGTVIKVIKLVFDTIISVEDVLNAITDKVLKEL